jgi:phage terminase small subunit
MAIKKNGANRYKSNDHQPTEKQSLFCEEVVKNGGDKVTAYLLAGYRDSGNKNAMQSNATILYNKPHIKKLIKKLQTQKNRVAKRKFDIDAKYILRRLHEIDQLDIIDIINDDMSGFKPLNQWPKPWRVSISAIDMRKIVSHAENKNDSVETLIASIKWPDKIKNLELMGKHINVRAFEKDNRIEINNNVNNNNQFDLSDLDDDDLKTFKQLLLKQSAIIDDRQNDKNDAIDVEYTDVTDD